MGNALTMEEYLTVEEVAALLKVDAATIYKWTSRKIIPCVRLSRKAVRFIKGKILAWVESKAVEPATQPERGRKNQKRNRNAGKLLSSKNTIDTYVEDAKREVLGSA